MADEKIFMESRFFSKTFLLGSLFQTVDRLKRTEQVEVLFQVAGEQETFFHGLPPIFSQTFSQFLILEELDNPFGRLFNRGMIRHGSSAKRTPHIKNGKLVADTSGARKILIDLFQDKNKKLSKQK